MWLGSGVIGGIGLGLGYISPVSTLIKWFPDRRGMATGMAIMGFGGGAMIGAPLADMLMNHFRTPDLGRRVADLRRHGASIYFVFMMGGAFGYRVPPPDWQPAGWTPPAPNAKAMITHAPRASARRAQDAAVLADLGGAVPERLAPASACIGMASPMLQEIFGGTLIGHPDVGFTAARRRAEGADRGHRRRLRRAAVAVQHRRPLLLGLAVRQDRPQDDLLHLLRARHRAVRRGAVGGAAGSKALFVGFFCIILSMYGGGFATVPAYLADMFGTQFVGAIHGRLLTAWSTAGIIGPVVVNYIREYELAAGVPRAQVYDVHHVHPGRHAGGRLRLQLAGQAGRPTAGS